MTGISAVINEITVCIVGYAAHIQSESVLEEHRIVSTTIYHNSMALQNKNHIHKYIR
ncbi:MAG: hypothetical protein J07HQW2_03708 [Haloquadratum walsbyi J07HQW2]|uniref:Uncharacterized protein n=1 Tax=Haloquadratum walsbyi J07HQW2 TaxID=1238425 RepID=U1PTT3_9EURY|nr:MAG: hypothetical protein J07HQW2_03708 [Haloquadratum walsbyi J07HQW2]